MEQILNFKKTISVSVDYNYLLTTPTGFDKEKESLPMIVFLHGAGERGDDVNRLKVTGLPKLFAKDPDYGGTRVITLSPQCTEGKNWAQNTAKVAALIEAVAEEYNVDRNRISLTGLSMGGFGTWYMGMEYPELFSALAPICGGARAYNASVLKNVPLWVFHGDADSVVPFDRSDYMVKVIRRLGGDPKFTVLPGVDHDSWTYAYEQTDLIEWLIAQNKKSRK